MPPPGAVERRTASPLINVHIFANRAFIPVFFFASVYGQIALGEKATTASLLILYFFCGFMVCAQLGGRMLDRAGAKRPVLLGSALAAAGFALWAGRRPTCTSARRSPTSSWNVAAIPAFIRADFAAATRDVLYAMAVIMAVAAFVALRGLRRGVQEDGDPAGVALRRGDTAVRSVKSL